MNRLYVIWTVTVKELLDFVRDWRTLAAMLLVPLILFPIIFIAVPWFLQGEAEELSSYTVDVNILIDDESNKLEKVLCNHCGRTINNGIRCLGICVADDEY